MKVELWAEMLDDQLAGKRAHQRADWKAALLAYLSVALLADW